MCVDFSAASVEALETLINPPHFVTDQMNPNGNAMTQWPTPLTAFQEAVAESYGLGEDAGASSSGISR